MTDVIQHQLELLVLNHSALRDVLVFCADTLIFLMAAALLATIIWRLSHVTGTLIARVAVMSLVAGVLTKLLAIFAVDVRPYIAEHFLPVVPIAHDNGFPSDHVLLAMLFTVIAWWLDRRTLPFFAVATLLIMAGRLAIGAHHTVDVLGSVVIVLCAAAVATAIPLPTSWNRPLKVLFSRDVTSTAQH